VVVILFYGRGKSSYGFIAKLLRVSRVTVMRWLKNFSKSLPEVEVYSYISEVSFDEM